jgi:hypothetical protein
MRSLVDIQALQKTQLDQRERDVIVVESRCDELTFLLKENDRTVSRGNLFVIFHLMDNQNNGICSRNCF